MAAAQADDPLAPVGVLLGGTLQRPYLQRRLAELNDGIVNVRFIMPSEFAMELGERAMIEAGKRPLPPLADRILTFVKEPKTVGPYIRFSSIRASRDWGRRWSSSVSSRIFPTTRSTSSFTSASRAHVTVASSRHLRRSEDSGSARCRLKRLDSVADRGLARRPKSCLRSSLAPSTVRPGRAVALSRNREVGVPLRFRLYERVAHLIEDFALAATGVTNQTCDGVQSVRLPKLCRHAS